MDQSSRFEIHEILNPPSELPAEIFDENYLQELKEHFPESSDQFENERSRHVLESEEYQSSEIQESEFVNENYPQTSDEGNRQSNEESKGRDENSFTLNKNLLKRSSQELETKKLTQPTGHQLEAEEMPRSEIQILETVKETHAQISYESIRESSEETTGRNESVLDVNEEHVPSVVQIETDNECKSRILNENVREKYICIICGKSCDSKRDLRRHQRHHLDGYPSLCSICGKAFDRESSLTVHMRTHTKEKPYACDKCGKSFSGKSTLNGHFLTHTEDKPFDCQNCGRAFRRKFDLLRHEQIHSRKVPLKCDVCEKRFEDEKKFDGHLCLHSRKYVQFVSILPKT